MSVPPELEWQRWSLREDGPVGWWRAGLVLLLVAVTALVLLVSLPPVSALVLSLCLLLTISPYFLPRKYRLGPGGVAVSRGFLTDQREWREFAAYQPVANGYWLLPVPAPANLSRARLRALYLPRPLDPTQAQQMAGYLANRLPCQETNPAKEL